MNITKKQLINFLLNKKINIYLINGWSSGKWDYDFYNEGQNGFNFGVVVCENGNIEIYDYRMSENLKNILLNDFKAINID